jgi:predicted nucleic acid-binding protein
MSTFLDTNVIVALLDTENVHHQWSVDELNRRKTEGPAIVCDIVYCELSVGMKNKDETDAAIRLFGLERLPHSDAALFRAGEAFKAYKNVNKGPKPGVLPDFLIGALAEVTKTPLMTANPKDFVGYFPAMQMISPGSN